MKKIIAMFIMMIFSISVTMSAFAQSNSYDAIEFSDAIPLNESQMKEIKGEYFPLVIPIVLTATEAATILMTYVVPILIVLNAIKHTNKIERDIDHAKTAFDKDNQELAKRYIAKAVTDIKNEIKTNGIRVPIYIPFMLSEISNNTRTAY